MNLQEQRALCLRMAFEMGAKPNALITAAEELMSYIERGVEPPAQQAIPVAEALPSPTPTSEVADPIAACGTALVLPESGDLAEAVVAAETVVIAAESEAPVSEATPEPALPEAGAEDVAAAEVAETQPDLEATTEAVEAAEEVAPAIEAAAEDSAVEVDAADASAEVSDTAAEPAAEESAPVEATSEPEAEAVQQPEPVEEAACAAAEDVSSEAAIETAVVINGSGAEPAAETQTQA